VALTILNINNGGGLSFINANNQGGIKLNIVGSPTPPPSFINPTLTTGSAVTIAAQSPFAGGGNSYQFSSNVNSFISTPGSSDWAVGTGDYTVEWFQYQTSTSSFPRPFSVGTYAGAAIAVSIEGGTFYYWANSGFRYSNSAGTVLNTWVHFAVVRQSNITKVYKNGTLLGSQITDNNNIVINDILVDPGTYLVGGTAARVPRISIKSKEWNPYKDKNRAFHLSRIDFGVKRTSTGAVTVDCFPSHTDESLGTFILETSPYTLVPLEASQRLLWHPIFLEGEGDSVQLKITYSDDQMIVPAIVESDFTLEGLVLYAQPTRVL